MKDFKITEGGNSVLVRGVCAQACHDAGTYDYDLENHGCHTLGLLGTSEICAQFQAAGHCPFRGSFPQMVLGEEILFQVEGNFTGKLPHLSI
jgi:hypothetical protein